MARQIQRNKRRDVVWPLLERGYRVPEIYAARVSLGLKPRLTIRTLYRDRDAWGEYRDATPAREVADLIRAGQLLADLTADELTVN